MRVSSISFLLSIGAAIAGMWLLLSDGKKGSEDIGSSRLATSRPYEGEDVRPGTAQAAASPTSHRDEYSDPPRKSQTQTAPIVGPREDVTPRHESGMPPESDITTESQGDAIQSSVVAHFRPSPSIEDRCRAAPVPTAASCERLDKSLKEMSREERDLEWATHAEFGIRSVVSTRGDGTEIRALECKTSLCAIETVSPGNEHFIILGQTEQESAGVTDDGDYVLAWEKDHTHGRVTITARIFARRAK